MTETESPAITLTGLIQREADKLGKLGSVLEPLVEWFDAAMERAYMLGLEDGARDENTRFREAVLAAAGQPSPRRLTIMDHAAEFAEGDRISSGNGVRRAPRGAVGAAVKQVLRAMPGQTQRELEDLAIAYDPSISRVSVGNELRRRWTIYVNRGGRWFLREKPLSAETAEPEGSADPSTPSSGDSDASETPMNSAA